MDSPVHISFQFTFADWMEICKNFVETLTKSKRKYLGFEFKKRINKELKNKKINCLVSNHSNWFKKERYRKKKCPYWTGLYKCSICEGRFNLKIHGPIEMNEDVTIGN